MCPAGCPLTKKPEDSGYEIALAQKADYSANRGLNLHSRGINFIPRLHFVPEKHD